MARWAQGSLGAQLHEAGFTARTIHALIYSLRLESLEELRTAEWGSVRDGTGLATVLSRLPNMGPKGFAEVQAFREHGDPRKANEIAATSVSAKFSPDELRALDEWAKKRGVTRTGAVRAIVRAAIVAE